jgi:hypothetical protein
MRLRSLSDKPFLRIYIAAFQIQRSYNELEAVQVLSSFSQYAAYENGRGSKYATQSFSHQAECEYATSFDPLPGPRTYNLGD